MPIAGTEKSSQYHHTVYFLIYASFFQVVSFPHVFRLRGGVSPVSIIPLLFHIHLRGGWIIVSPHRNNNKKGRGGICQKLSYLENSFVTMSLKEPRILFRVGNLINNASVVTPEMKRPLGRPCCRRRVLLKLILKNGV
jgi:hypothetical protein